jgi:hypothetical protein
VEVEIMALRSGLLALAVCWCSSAALAQWVTFSNQTSQRLVAAAGVGTSDPEEKSYAFGDFDHDGDLDVVCVRKTPFTTDGKRRGVLFMNEGIAEGHAINGVLVDRTATLAPALLDLINNRDVAVLDLNGDGWVDLITATTLGKGAPKDISHPRVYINKKADAGGNWLGFAFDDVNRIPTWPSFPAFASVCGGDFDLDGDIDLYFTDYSSSVASNPLYSGVAPLDDRLLINNGNGYFTDQTEARMSFAMYDSAFGTSSQVADLNQDGYLDILKDTALFPPQNVRGMYNNPAQPGFFNKMTILYSLAPYFVNVGDLNNDGRPDFAISDDNIDRYGINTGLAADGTATFTIIPFQYISGDDGFGGNNYIEDLNNDGFADVVITDVDVDISGCFRRMHVFRNLGNVPNVTLAEQALPGGMTTSTMQGTHDVAIFDLDGDGWKDMLQGTCTTTRVWMNQPPAGLVFSYPTGLPAFTPPSAPLTFQVKVSGVGGAQPVAGTGKMYVSVAGGAFTATSMTHLGGSLYEAVMQGVSCATSLDFYFSSDKTGGGTLYDPPTAPTASYTAFAASGIDIQIENFEGSVAGWTVTNDPSLTGGAWQQATPNGTQVPPFIAAPYEDATEGAENTKCFVTENGLPGGAASASDVDGGPTWLTSPVINLAGTDAKIDFAAWFFCDDPVENPGHDVLKVEVSNNGGGSWATVMNIDDSGQKWTNYGFWVSDHVAPTGNVKVRFSTSDIGTGILASVTEAGIDKFTISKITCGPSCPGDINGDGKTTQEDLGIILANWGCIGGACVGDLDHDGLVGQTDLGALLADWLCGV